MKHGWEIKRLGDVCELMNGYAFQSKQYTDEGYFVIRIGNVQDGYIELNNPRYIKLKDEKQKKFILQSGDILISLTGNVGRVGAIQEEHLPAVLNQRVAKIAIKKEQRTDNEYFLHFLSSEYFISELIKAGRRAAQQNISTTDIENLQIPLPPLPEQQRIVAILDEAFPAIAKAKANAEQNLKNAKELFESYLQGVFENGNWEEKKLNEITEVKDGTHESPKYIKEGIPFVTQKNIRQDGLSFSDTRFITEADHEKFYKRSNVTFGDILISMIGANRGMAAIVDDERIFSIKNVGLIKESKNINKYFLLYYLKSSLAMKYVLYMSNGGAQEFVGLTALRSFPIPYPSLKDQQIIVQKLDALSAETKKLEAIYQQKINDLEELKKSILQKAFAGELRSPEGAEYTNDVATPLAKKKTITNPERA
jgi:type I restriction enzyme S subunit